MAVDRTEAVLQHLRVVIVQNLDDIPECTNQQHLIQMGCPATAVMTVSMATLPHRIIVGGGVPVTSAGNRGIEGAFEGGSGHSFPSIQGKLCPTIEQ